jgi:hypothetical protein
MTVSADGTELGALPFEMSDRYGGSREIADGGGVYFETSKGTDGIMGGIASGAAGSLGNGTAGGGFRGGGVRDASFGTLVFGGGRGESSRVIC